MTINRESLRPAFELWARDRNIQLTMDVGREDYQYPTAKAAWAAWCAAFESLGEPVLYLRVRNGTPDWGEDCVSPDTACLDEFRSDSSYSALPLYRLPEVKA